MALKNLTIQSMPKRTVVWSTEATAYDTVYWLPEPVRAPEGKLVAGLSVPSRENWLVPTNIEISVSETGDVFWTPWATPHYASQEEYERKQVGHVLESNAEYYSAITEGEQ